MQRCAIPPISPPLSAPPRLQTHFATVADAETCDDLCRKPRWPMQKPAFWKVVFSKPKKPPHTFEIGLKTYRFAKRTILHCKTHRFGTQNAPFWKSGVALALCNKCGSKAEGESIYLIIRHLRGLLLGGFRQIQRCSCPCVSRHDFHHICHPLHVQILLSRLRNAPSNTLLPLFFLPTFPVLVEQNITY